MIRVFRHYVPNAALLLGLLDLILLVAAAEAGWVIRARQIDMLVEPIGTRVPQLLAFALTLQIALVAVGAYGAVAIQSLRFAASRLLVAVSLGVLGLSLIYFMVPALTFWRSNLLFAMVFAILGLVAMRALLGKAIGGEALRRRVVILGAGARAQRIVDLAARQEARFVVAGVVAMGATPVLVPQAIPREAIGNLAAYVRDRDAAEVVLAIDERRNALPLQDLLRVKTTGVEVLELSSFIERETGRIDLQTVNPSWLIFSDGFSSGRVLTAMAKRAFDIAASAILLVIALPLIVLIAVAIRLESPGPAIYRQRRVGLFNEPFDILKLRSMRQDAEAGGKAIWAAERDPRVTRIGRFIRTVRIDELPQCWSVLRGDMSFVGPRPERPQFVADLERELPYYAERHMVKPGITGWAQINYPYGASVEDARHKLEYDLYYAKNYSPLLDLLILLQTLRVVLWPAGAR